MKTPLTWNLPWRVNFCGKHICKLPRQISYCNPPTISTFANRRGNSTLFLFWEVAFKNKQMHTPFSHQLLLTPLAYQLLQNPCVFQLCSVNCQIHFSKFPWQIIACKTSWHIDLCIPSRSSSFCNRPLAYQLSYKPQYQMAACIIYICMPAWEIDFEPPPSNQALTFKNKQCKPPLVLAMHQSHRSEGRIHDPCV